jgi:hypothetical protein
MASSDRIRATSPHPAGATASRAATTWGTHDFEAEGLTPRSSFQKTG